MIDPENLKFGQTPFDDMTREELLDEVKTQFNALMSASSALHMLSYFERDTNPFWGHEGTGGRAYYQIESIINRVNRGRDDGLMRISRSYFRYGDHLHFPDIPSRDPWWINSKGDLLTGKKKPHMEGWVNDWEPLGKDFKHSSER